MTGAHGGDWLARERTEIGHMLDSLTRVYALTRAHAQTRNDAETMASLRKQALALHARALEWREWNRRYEHVRTLAAAAGVTVTPAPRFIACT